MRADVINDAKRFKQSRDNARTMRERFLARALEQAKRFGVLVYVFYSRKGLVMDTARPQVSNAWRVAPSGTVTQVNSGE